MVEKMVFFLLAVIARAAIASALLACALLLFLLGLHAWRLCRYTPHGMTVSLSDNLMVITFRDVLRTSVLKGCKPTWGIM